MQEFVKPGALTLVMPVWSWEELDVCRKLAYPNADEQRAKHLFSRYGGVPRYVLERQDTLPQDRSCDEDELNAAIREMSTRLVRCWDVEA